MAWYERMVNGLLDPEMQKQLTPEQKRAIAWRAVGGFGQGMLSQAGWSQVPQSGAEGLAAGMQGFQQALSGGVDSAITQRAYAQQNAIAQQKAQQAADEAKHWSDPNYLTRLAQATGRTPEEIGFLAQLPASQRSAAVSKLISAARQGPKEDKDAAARARRAASADRYGLTGMDRELYIESGKAPPRPKAAKAASGPSQPRIMTAAELRITGMPPGTQFTVSKSGEIKPLKTDAGNASASGGAALNDRQAVAVQSLRKSALNYTASLTGVSDAELATLSPAEIEALILQRGGRMTQGPIAGRIPFSNADLEPYTAAAASAKAMYDNPTGMVTNADREAALPAVPNSRMPLPVQAKLVRQMLESEQQRKRPEEMTDEELLQLLRSGQ